MWKTVPPAVVPADRSGRGPAVPAPAGVRDLIDRARAAPLDVPSLARSAHVFRIPLQPLVPGRVRREAPPVPAAQGMERAKALLRAGDLPVTEVCRAVGFTSPGPFTPGSAGSSARAPRPTGFGPAATGSPPSPRASSAATPAPRVERFWRSSSAGRAPGVPPHGDRDLGGRDHHRLRPDRPGPPSCSWRVPGATAPLTRERGRP